MKENENQGNTNFKISKIGQDVNYSRRRLREIPKA